MSKNYHAVYLELQLWRPLRRGMNAQVLPREREPREFLEKVDKFERLSLD